MTIISISTLRFCHRITAVGSSSNSSADIIVTAGTIEAVSVGIAGIAGIVFDSTSVGIASVLVCNGNVSAWNVSIGSEAIGGASAPVVDIVAHASGIGRGVSNAKESKGTTVSVTKCAVEQARIITFAEAVSGALASCAAVSDRVERDLVAGVE